MSLKYIFIFLFAGVLILFPACSDEEFKTEDTTEFNRMEWLLGIWKGRQGDAELYESWRRKSFRIMEGMSFTTQNKRRVFSQSMRIEQNNNRIYMIITEDTGNEQVILNLSEIDDSKVTFTNTGDTYPNRIVYQKKPKKRMKVMIEGRTEDMSAELDYKKTHEL